MRFRTLTLVFTVIICLTFLAFIFTEFGQAEPANIQVEGEPTYYLYRAGTHPTKYYYYINVALYNSGDEPSVPIDIKLFEDEKPTVWPESCRRVSFSPHENKTFTFNWSSTCSYKTVEIVYGPSDPNVLATENNSGSKTVLIGTPPTGDENTPGFELSLPLVIALIFVSLKRFKVKKHR